MQRILITGGAGFIGSHLADALVGRESSSFGVRAVVNDGGGATAGSSNRSRESFSDLHNRDAEDRVSSDSASRPTI